MDDTPLSADQDAEAGRGDESPLRRRSLLRDGGIQSTRPSYFQGLRDGRVPSLRLEDGSITAAGIDTITNANASSVINSSSSPPNAPGGLHQQFASFRTSMRGRKVDPTSLKVEVRMKDYSYHVPIRVDAPSIKTVFNTSPCYVGTSFLKNVGELMTGERKVGCNLLQYIMITAPFMFASLITYSTHQTETVVYAPYNSGERYLRPL